MVLGAPAVAAADEPTAGKADGPFVPLSSLGCSGCHPKQYSQWSVSLHAQAHTEPIYNIYFIKASQQSKKKLETFCGACHTPLGVRSGQIPYKKALEKVTDTQVDPVSTEGVQCDFCHTITGHTMVGNSGFVGAASDTMLGPIKDPKPVTHRARHAPHLRGAEYCGTCHQVTHPGNGIKLETTYEEWKKGPYAAAGVVCQDCHMSRAIPAGDGTPAGIKPPVKDPGKAAVMGPRRPHISDHRFVGPNVMFTASQGAEGARLREAGIALLRRAGRLEIGEPVPGKAGVVLPVRVTNVGAGHNLPTGVTEIREMWLEVTVKDRRGKVVLRSGDLDASGNIKPGAVVYRTEVHDAQGRDTTLFWNTVKKARDYRIPPLATVTERYPLPAGARGAVTVEARLLYRSVSPRGLAEAGVPPGTVKVPVISMAEARRTIRLR